MKIDSLFSVVGKVAIVTGGGQGIGEMIARGLVENGARVYISSRKVEVCAATAADLSKIGECISIPADLSGVPGCEQLTKAISERESKVHILVNNAGATWGAPLEDYPDAAFDRVFGVNIKGPFHLTRLLLPQLKAAATAEDPARVINIGSVDGIRVPNFDISAKQTGENYPYAVTKAGIHMLTRHLAHRLAPEHITVNAIAPGPFATKMTAFMLKSEAGRTAMSATVPLGRIGKPEDAAGLTIFLSSAAGSYLTGAIIPLDGGVSTHG